MRTIPSLLIALVVVAGVALPAQQPSQTQPSVTFKVEVNYVEIDATVTDASGAFVGNLTKDDFRVVEEGTPQTISAFAQVDIPIERPDAPLFRPTAVEPDVHTNHDEFNGRVFVLVLDDLQTDFRRSARVKAAARQFVERYVGANDLVAILQTGGGAQASQEFTSSRPRLLASIDKFAGRKLPSATLAKLDDYYQQRGLGTGRDPRDANDLERSLKARNTLGALGGVADFLGGIRGRRKAVIWFSEGIDYDTTNPFDSPDAGTVRDAMRDAIAAATRANATFYAIDARGLGAGMEEAMDIAALPDDPTVNLGVTAIQDEVRRAHDSQLVLSEETGGFATVNRNNMSDAFARIISDNSHYYVLGYYATNDKRDGRFRKVQVEVTRPGLKVQARKGYAAPKGRASTTAAAPAGKVRADVREALDSPIPMTGVGLALFAAPFTGPGGKASVAISLEIDPGSLKFVESNGTFNEDLDIVVLAIDAKNKMQDGGGELAPMHLSPASHDLIMRSGMRVMRRLTLPPGRYQIRAAVRDVNGGAIGTVRQELDVPDFSRTPLLMSGITIASAYASRVPTVNADPNFKDVLPAAPTALRVFPRNDTLSVFAEVYDNQSSVAHRVAMKTSILADDGKVMFTTADERRSEELQGKKGGYGYTVKIPLAELTPGRYVLKIEASTLLSNGGSAMRELEFRVR